MSDTTAVAAHYSTKLGGQYQFSENFTKKKMIDLTTKNVVKGSLLSTPVGPYPIFNFSYSTGNYSELIYQFIKGELDLNPRMMIPYLNYRVGNIVEPTQGFPSLPVVLRSMKREAKFYTNDDDIAVALT